MHALGQCEIDSMTCTELMARPVNQPISLSLFLSVCVCFSFVIRLMRRHLLRSDHDHRCTSNREDADNTGPEHAGPENDFISFGHFAVCSRCDWYEIGFIGPLYCTRAICNLVFQISVLHFPVLHFQTTPHRYCGPASRRRHSVSAVR